MSQDAKLYRLLFEHSTQGLVVLRDGRIELANRSFADMVGYALDDILGSPLDSILSPVYPQDYGMMLAQIQELLAGKGVPRYGELRFVRGDGEMRWCTVTMSLISHEGEAAVLGALLDITERKRAEEALQESLAREKYLGDILRNASVAIAVGYPEGRVEWVNTAFQALTGYSEEELKTIDWNLDLTPPEWREHEAAQLRELDCTRKAVRYEKEYLRKDGSRVPVELVVHAHLDADGNVVSYFAFVSDISERKQAEAVQSEYQATVRALLNTPAEMVFVLSVDGIILTLNEAAARNIGKRPEELSGSHFRSLVPPEEVRFREQQFADVARSRRPLTCEDQRQGMWFESTIFPIQDAGGEVTRFVVFTRDITERKQAEAILKEHEATVRALLNAPTESVLMVHVDGTVLAVNEITARRLGKRPEELIGKPLQSIIAPEVAEFRVEHFTEACRTGLPVSFEDQRAGMWFESTAYPIQDADGRVTRLVVFARDITERKQAEEALRASKQLLDSIIDTVPLGVALTDSEGTFVRVNDEYCRILALSREEILNKPFSIVFPPEAADMVWATYKKILGGELEVALERAYRRRDGTVIYVDTTNAIVYDQEGAPLVVTVVRDVTALKQAEQQRMAFALEQERMRILTDFITHASHEFRTPLSVINTSAYLLKRSADAEARQRHLSAIEAQTESITTLVEALITMLRLDSSRETFTRPVDLCGVVEGVYQRKRGEFEAGRLRTGLEFEARPVIVLGDATYLSQAVTCILDNALRFTPEDGAIQVRVEIAGQDAVIEVADTGSGIGQDDLEHIFERFYRADKARTTRGLGLGLPIAQAIVERHQGRIEVESALGRGSTFRVFLPLRA